MTQQQDTPKVTGESSAVQSYLGILQNIISRMAKQQLQNLVHLPSFSYSGGHRG
jgi:hypothetical protein